MVNIWGLCVLFASPSVSFVFHIHFEKSFISIHHSSPFNVSGRLKVESNCSLYIGRVHHNRYFLKIDRNCVSLGNVYQDTIFFIGCSSSDFIFWWLKDSSICSITVYFRRSLWKIVSFSNYLTYIHFLWFSNKERYLSRFSEV